MRSHAPLLFVSLGVILLSVAGFGSESAPMVRQGHFARLTDCAASQYVIESFRMSGDGSRIVFYVRQTVEDTRGCFAHQLRMINADGADESVVEQGFTYDTGVGNYCANSLYDTYAISSDGGTIAYLRLRGPEDLQPELMVYDVAHAAKTSVLQTLPNRSYGETALHDIDPFGDWKFMAMTGDGTQVFFINSFGPYGPPGASGDPGPSGFSVYRVPTDGSGAACVYTSADLAVTPGVSPAATYVVASGGHLAVDRTGSLLLLPVGGNFPSANPPLHLLKIDPSVGAASAEVLLDFIGLGLSGPALSEDGLTAVFARSGSSAPEMNGLFARGITPESPEIRLDANLRWGANPALSEDGSAVVYNVDQGGGSSPALRYAATDGALHIPLTLPVTRTRFDYGSVSADGGRVVFCGAIEGVTIFDPVTQYDLICMNWNSGAEPRIENVTAEPELTLLRQPPVDYERAVNTHFYAVAGSNLAGMYSYPFNSDASVPGGTSEFHIHGGILDDGVFDGDAVAGDGIFTENGLFISSETPEAPLKLRVGVTTASGTAAFADLEIPLRDEVLATADFSVAPVVGAAPLEAVFQDSSTGDYLETRWDFNGNGTIDDTGAAGESSVHTFENAGDFRPRLTVTGRGSTNELRDSVIIRVFGDAGDMARTLADELDSADADASGGLDFIEAITLVPGLTETLFNDWDGNVDGALTRRELLLGAGGERAVHTADRDADLRIQLTELLRLIQFFNSGGFHCAESPEATEDGYAVGGGDHSCSFHFSDYAPQDWVVQLTELLRAIQMFNSGGYVPCPGDDTEDGFCPGRD